MKKYKKLIFIGFLLVVLVGCTPYLGKDGKIIEASIIKMGDTWKAARAYESSWLGTFFVWPLAQLLNFFEQYLGALGAILIVTALIKLVTIRSSIKSTVQQQKMAMLGPDQARIEEKYRGRDDQQAKLQKATEIQNLYKKHGINPLGAMGGLLLSFPVMIAMYQSVGRAENIITGTLFGQTLDKTPLWGFQNLNFLYIGVFITMAALQFLSMFIPQYLAKQKVRRRPNDKKPETPGQSMMYVSLIMIVVLGLTWPIGMSLYWAASSLLTLVQTLFINWKYSE